MAELILVRGLMGDRSFSERMSKSLGDLSISRGGLSDELTDKQAQLENCVARWEIGIQTGGDVTPGTSLRPGHSVKGALSEDSMSTGRQSEARTFQIR